jgi:hypothetical protein
MPFTPGSFWEACGVHSVPGTPTDFSMPLLPDALWPHEQGLPPHLAPLLRHHLIEAGTHLCTIQILLGHAVCHLEKSRCVGGLGTMLVLGILGLVLGGANV